MPALYNMIITTKGLNLRARADAEELVLQFTKVAIGNGEYDGSEDLLSLTDLKSKKQELAINSKTYANNTVSLKTVVTNTDLEEGYYIKEIGVYAQDPDEPEGTEILYSISLAIDDKWDFLPAEEWGPASIQLSIDTAITNADTVEIKPGSGAYALAEDLAALQSPEFEDYEGETTLPEMDTALGQIKTGNPLVKLLQYIKAALRILDEREVDMSPYDQAIQELIDTDDQLNEDIATHKKSNDHDGRYYTETEVNNLLSGKAASNHNHDGRYYTETEVNNLLSGKAASNHNHDERYFTETEIKAKLEPFMMAQGWAKYTTKTWSQGTGGATCTADKDGWYIAKCTFTGDTGNIDAQFQLMAGNTMIGITSVYGWSGNFPAAQCMGFGYFAKGTVFKPYIHTSTAGAIINTYMDLIRIYS